MRTHAHPPEGPGPSPIPPLELGHSAPGIAGSPWGNTGPTWAQPLGPFITNSSLRPEGQGHMVSELRAFVHPQLSPVSCKAPSWGLSYWALGLLPSSEELGSCCHGNLSDLLGAHCSVPTGALRGGCLPKLSWCPQHLRLPFKAFQGRGPNPQCRGTGLRPRRHSSPDFPLWLCLGWSPSWSSPSPLLLPRKRTACCVSAFPQRCMEEGQAHSPQDFVEWP